MNKIVPLVMMTMVAVGIGSAKELPALSKLSVSGNRIVNEEGQEVRLRGVNFADPFLLENDHPDGDGVPDHHFSKKIVEDFAAVKKLGANVVRLAIYPGYYRLVGGESYLTTYVDREVDLAEKNGLYIILSYQVIGRPGGWYDAPSDATLWQYPAKIHYTDSEMAVAFWNKVAARYGQRKHVLFEIYNEPADETADFTWADWRPTGELLIATIRKHSNNIVLGSGPKYSSDLSDVLKNPYSDSNLVYVAHIYPITVPKGKDLVSEWERLFGFLAKTYPVIVSEWGFSNGGDETTNGTLEGYGRPLLDYLDQKKIHWIAFIYHPMDPGQGQLMLESDWTTLTEFGQFVKQRLQGGTTLSKLSVSGNRIVNEEGQEIRLRGVNFEDPFVLEKDDLNQDGTPDNHFVEIEADFKRIKKLGANIVRLPLYPGYYFLVGKSYLTRYVDRMIDLAEENGLYAIISYHAIGRPGGWYESVSDQMLWNYPVKLYYTDTDMAVAFWNTVAARYCKRKHVLFEIYNEPADNPNDATDDLTWDDWRPTGELLIATIRQHSDNIVLGPGLNYTNDLSAVPTNPYSDSNLVYVAHVYPNTVPKGEDQVSEWERLFGFLAKTYPVIVSEWGFHDGGKDETTSGTLKDFGRPLLDYLDQKNIHWVAYLYHPPDAEPPMLEADWTTLNEFGRFVKERLQS